MVISKVVRGGTFYNRTMDRWLEDDGIERYSTYNEGKVVEVGQFNRTLKQECGNICRPTTPIAT